MWGREQEGEGVERLAQVRLDARKAGGARAEGWGELVVGVGVLLLGVEEELVLGLEALPEAEQLFYSFNFNFEEGCVGHVSDGCG